MTRQCDTDAAITRQWCDNRMMRYMRQCDDDDVMFYRIISSTLLWHHHSVITQHAVDVLCMHCFDCKVTNTYSQGQVTKIETHSNYNTFKSKYNLNELTPTALIQFILGCFWKAFRIYCKENAFNRSNCAPRILLQASFNVLSITIIRPL